MNTTSKALTIIILLVACGIGYTGLVRKPPQATTTDVSKVPQGVPMSLLVAIDSPAQLGALVQLQDAAGCRYVGKLEQRNGEPESTLVKLLNQANGNVGSWSIAISSKTCGTIREEAELVVPLRNIISKADYAAGAKVQAYSLK